MVKSETEFDDSMRCSKKIIYQFLSVRIKINIGTSHYHGGKELFKSFQFPYYTSFSTVTGVLNPKLTEEELYIMPIFVKWLKNWFYLPMSINKQFELIKYYLNQNNDGVTQTNDKS